MFKRLKQELYADEAVNRDRQIGLDCAKFAAIFCLALIHCTIECIPEEGLASGIPYLFDTVMFGEGQNCYYHITTPDVLASICAAAAALGVWYVLARFLPGPVLSVMAAVSRNITRVYCIHWVILSFTVNVALYAARGTQALSVPATLLLGTAISVVSMALACGLGAHQKKCALEAVK